MQLLEALLDLGEQRAARDRDDHVVGCLPSELLRGLERERLRTLGVERPHVDVDERPLVQPGELRAEAVDVVVVAFDRDEVAAVDRRGDDLALLEVGRDEHVRPQARVRRVRGDGVREVAGRCARRDLEAELERLAQRDRDHPVLERVRRVARVVLDPDLAEAELGREAIGAHERREAGAEVDRGVAVHRQQVGVAPQRQRTGGDLLAADAARDRVVVVGHFERAEAPLARVDRRGLVLATALPTAQTLHVGSGNLDVMTGRSTPRRRHANMASLLLSPSVRRALERLERKAAHRLSHRSGIGTLLTGTGGSPGGSRCAGCRGVKGPVPQPLWMSACPPRVAPRPAPLQRFRRPIVRQTGAAQPLP